MELSRPGLFAEQLSPSEIRYESGGAVTEILNSVSHAVGVGLSIGGLVALLILTGLDPSPWKYVGFSIYGGSQILLFLSSSLLHGFAALPRIRRTLRILDQCFIYVMIAGTYTPVCLVALRGGWGWSIFGIIWGLALAGILLKSLVLRERHLITDLLFIPMGWIVVIAIGPLIRATEPGFVLWVLIGGVCYTAGAGFYAWKRLPLSHLIWHFFVIAGSLSFLMAFSLHLA